MYHVYGIVHTVILWLSQHQQGYRISIWRSVVIFSLATLPCGLGLLLSYWFPHIILKLIASKCPMEQATHLLLKVVPYVCVCVCTHIAKLYCKVYLNQDTPGTKNEWPSTKETSKRSILRNCLLLHFYTWLKWYKNVKKTR